MMAKKATIANVVKSERKKQKTQRVISSAKCIHLLPPFGPHFDPKIHNKYIAARENREKKNLEENHQES